MSGNWHGCPVRVRRKGEHFVVQPEKCIQALCMLPEDTCVQMQLGPHPRHTIVEEMCG